MKREPLWRMPPRAQAIDVLVASRAGTDELVAQLRETDMKIRTLLGGGLWSVKDLLGHLASTEERALFVATERRLRHQGLELDERNAAEIARKESWSVRRVRDDLERVRSELIAVIDDMSDDAWTRKIQLTNGRSALGLVLGKILVGGRFGLFAHDLAHRRDLERSVRALRDRPDTR